MNTIEAQGFTNKVSDKIIEDLISKAAAMGIVAVLMETVALGSATVPVFISNDSITREAMAMATYVAEDRETKIILVSDALLGTGLYEFSVLHEAGHLLEGVDTKDRSYKNQIRQELAADNYALANGAELSDGFKICKLALNMMAISNISIAEKIKMTVVNAARVINFITKL